MRAAVVFVKNPDGKFLILKRNLGEGWMAGRWGLPGGWLDKGESPLDACLREAKEEANIHIKGLMLIHRKKEKDLEVSYFLTAEWNGIVKLSFEHTKFDWVYAEELKYYDTVPELENIALQYAI